MKRSRLRQRYGHAKGSGWAAGRKPSSQEIWASGKPIVVAKEGSGWTVSVMGRPVVRHNGKLTFAGRTGAPAGGTPEKFETRDEAAGIAHQIGRYMLNLGDLVFEYVE